MTFQTETPPQVEATGLQNCVRSDARNTSGDTSRHVDFQAVDKLDALIEASKDCERAIARRQLMQRRMTLNLIVYRDNLLELGKAVWKGAV